MVLSKLLHGVQLKAKIITATTTVIILTTVIGSGFFYARTKAIIFESFEKRGKAICENLSNSVKYGVLTEDKATLNELVERVLWAEDVVYVIVQSEDGRTLAEKAVVKLADVAKLKKKALQAQHYKMFPGQDAFGDPLYSFTYPIVARKVSIAEIGGVESEFEEETTPHMRGTVQIGLSLRNILSKLKNILHGVIALTIIIIGCGIIFSFGLVRIIMRPIQKMANAAAKVASGDLTQTVEVESHDEIGQFAMQFNTMTQALQQRDEQLQESYEELSISEERYRVFVRNSSEGIWCFEPQNGQPYPNDLSEDDMINWTLTHSVLVECNDAMAKAHGLGKREDMLGLPLSNFMPKKDLRNIESLRSFIRNNYSLVDVETEASDLHGNTHVMLNNLIGITKNSRLLRVWGIQRDITEMKRAEQIQMDLFDQIKQANQELKDFAYITSHDLKAPLRGIKTLAEWIETDYTDKFDDKGKEQLNLLLTRVGRMHNLIDGILQYSRVGRVKEKLAWVNLQQLVPEIIDMIAPPDNIEITILNDLPMIEAEKTRIQQVFQNLLSNAVKYMDKPQGKIQISCVDENGLWKFCVADNGPGIEKKYYEKIFRIFQTLTPRDEFESTGVGLTLVKKIVELYGGNIWLESQVGEGTKFFFTLPKQEEKRAKNAKLEANTVS